MAGRILLQSQYQVNHVIFELVYSSNPSVFREKEVQK